MKNQYSIVLLGVVYDPMLKKVLIGRRENDPNIPNLTWCFPGGEAYKLVSFPTSLRQSILRNTGFDVNVRELIHARPHPDNMNIATIYYDCTLLGGTGRCNGSLVELKWVNPEDVSRHFTSAVNSYVQTWLDRLRR